MGAVETRSAPGLPGGTKVKASFKAKREATTEPRWCSMMGKQIAKRTNPAAVGSARLSAVRQFANQPADPSSARKRAPGSG